MNKKWISKLLLTTIILGIAFTAETAFCTRVAVIDFESIGDMPDIGRAVTEVVRTELIKTGKYEVVERALLNKIIEEQRFQLSDLVDPSKAVELGNLLGADLLLTGSVVKIGSSYTINARFIDVKTGMAKRAEAIRGNEINELTYMSSQLIGILEQGVKPTPVVRPEKRQERPPVPAPTGTEIKVGPRSYLTFSVGRAAFAMKDLNDEIESFNAVLDVKIDAIDSGLNLDFGGGIMVTEKIGLGLSTSFLRGVASGGYYKIRTNEYGVEIGQILIPTEFKVIGITFALRPFLRQELGDHIALCLGGDVGVISLRYSYLTERDFGAGEDKASGTGPLFGGFASAQLLVGSFFLQGDVGFRSAKGEVEFEEYDATKELDFSGSYLLMRAGIRF